MQYTAAFFALNLEFAAKVAEVTGLPLPQALLEYTHLYPSFGLGRGFDPANATWQSYLAGLENTSEPAEWTQQIYLAQPFAAGGPAETPTFGCFSYAVWDGGRIRLHFAPQAQGPAGPLSVAMLPARLAELTALFAHVRQHVASAQTVVGGSWLYNIAAYRRLFPPEYLATAHHEEPEYQFIAQWGQLLDRFGQVRANTAAEFRARLSRTATPAGLADCFPYPVLRLESDISAFYPYYRI